MSQPNPPTPGNNPFDPNSFGRAPFETTSASRPQNNGPQSNGPQNRGPQNSGPAFGTPPNPGPQYAGPQYTGPQYTGQRPGGVPPFASAPWRPYTEKSPNGCWVFVKRLLLAVVGFFLFLFIIGTILGVMVAGVGGSDTKVIEKTLSGDVTCPAKIVILPIEGTITEDEDGFVRHAIRTAYEDKRVAGIVLRVNSPGGTISGSDYYYHLLQTLKNERHIPIVVSMGSIAASGGYYVAMAGDEIFAERSTITGSIGVIVMLLNGAGLCEKAGVSMNNIVSGPNKGMGDFTRPLSEEERAIWQGMVDESYQQFLSVIREGRPVFAKNAESENAEAKNAEPENAEEELTDTETEKKEPKGPEKSLEEIADGRIYSAAEAKQLGLIDGIGFMDDAVKATLKRAGLSAKSVQVVRYKKPEGLAELLTQAESGGASGRIGTLVETLAVPQLYYLAPGALPVR